MNLKLRLNKLEQRQPTSSLFNGGPVALVGMSLDESEDHACKRWCDDNPGKALPDNRIYLVPFRPGSNTLA